MKECNRILSQYGVMRVSVPDADLRTYEKPEPIGYPGIKLSFNNPAKHKTRWSIYMLEEALKFSNFNVIPIRYCDKNGNYCKNIPKRYMECPEYELIEDMSYMQRKDSLIVDAIKCKI